ncbi:MAG TPA: type III secretion HpaP family protein [Burkholderiaceae bacterium]|nr:type III secretion HpaP family protein [Burkholderiaceae bacterium]
MNDTANLVYSLCSGVPTAFQAWNLTVPIGAEPLADTQLNLSLSPHTLTLRFQPGSSSSEGLILKHRSQLKALLEEHPAIPSNIDIDTV